MAVATFLLPRAEGTIALGLLVILFAENGLGRAVVESLSGAEATALADPDRVGAELGSLRFWKPLGIILVAILGMVISKRFGVASILGPIAVFQAMALGFAWLIHEDKTHERPSAEVRKDDAPGAASLRDPGLWAFVAAMVLYHAANAPGGVYLGLFLKRTLGAPEWMLGLAFVVSMVAWMLVVWPAGWLADRIGRKPLLIAGWTIMAIRLAIVGAAPGPWVIVANQALDGLSNGIFAVIAAAWVTDRLGDPRRSGEAQAIVGCSLVFGSALGPFASGFLVGPLGYRATFGVLAGVGVVGLAILAILVPETRPSHREVDARGEVEPMGLVSDLSTSP